MIAAHTGSVAIVKTLRSCTAHDVNASQGHAGHALMWAVATLSTKTSRARVDREPGQTCGLVEKRVHALDVCRAQRRLEIARLLIDATRGGRGTDAAADGTHVLHLRSSAGRTSFALFLLDEGPNANGSMDGVRALHAAAGPVDICSRTGCGAMAQVTSTGRRWRRLPWAADPIGGPRW